CQDASHSGRGSQSTPSKQLANPDARAAKPDSSPTTLPDDPITPEPVAKGEDSSAAEESTGTETDHRKALIATLVDLLDSARAKIHNEDLDGADDDYRQARRQAAEFSERFSDLTRQERRICSIVSYFFARALARADDPRQSFAALQRAV